MATPTAKVARKGKNSALRGRPQVASQDFLAEAALELFLERGYHQTTLNQITARAGVSRSTFFNYFTGKADTIWFVMDRHLADLHEKIIARAKPLPKLLLAAAGNFVSRPPETLALAIVNAEQMGIAQLLLRERAIRQARLVSAITQLLCSEQGFAAQNLETRATAAEVAQVSALISAEITASAYATALFSAIWGWAAAGANPKVLQQLLAAALRQ